MPHSQSKTRALVVARRLARRRCRVGPRAQQDFSAVQIKTHQVAGNVHYLEGQGGNVGLLVGDDGVLMIDDQFAPLSEKLAGRDQDAVATSRSACSSTRTSTATTRAATRTSASSASTSWRTTTCACASRAASTTAAPSPAVALPVVTYGDTMSLHLNGETVTIGKLPPAHTDGDSYIHFANADVIHAGDVFRTIGYPGVDVNNGGTVKGTIEALQALVDMAGPNTKIIPGHGVVSTRDDVAAFRDQHDRAAAALHRADQARDDARAGRRRESDRRSRREVRSTERPPPDALRRSASSGEFYNALKSERRCAGRKSLEPAAESSSTGRSTRAVPRTGSSRRRAATSSSRPANADRAQLAALARRRRRVARRDVSRPAWTASS